LRRNQADERFWLALAAIMAAAGVSFVLASDQSNRWSDPFSYIGLGLIGVALYLLVASAIYPLPLLKLRGERESERFSDARDVRVARGDELYGRVVTSEDELQQFRDDYTHWVLDTAEWLRREVSGATASDFQHVTGNAAAVPESFNMAHNNLRLRVSWQVRILRRVEP
jgi:hypothetical protein